MKKSDTKERSGISAFMDRISSGLKYKVYKKSIFINSIIIFVAISILIFSVGSLIVVKQRNILTKQYETAVKSQIENYYTQLEQKLQNIRVQQNTMASDDDFSYLLNKKTFDYSVSRAVNSVGTKLMLLEESSEYMDKVQIYFQSLDNCIIAKDQKQEYTKADNEIVREIMKQRANPNFEYFDGKLYIITSPGSYEKGIHNNSYAILSSISINQLYEDIQQFELDKRAVSMLTFDNYDICKTEKGKEALFEGILKEDSHQGEVEISYTEYENEKYIAATYYSEFLQSKYAQAIPVKAIFKNLEELKNLYIVFSFITITAVLLFIWFTYKSVKKPLNELMDAFSSVENENFSVRLKDSAPGEFLIVFDSFNKMAGKLGRLINDVYMQEILVQRAELRQLQAQINPHFLYNSFFILKNRIVSGSQAEAQRFCEMLGVYFSYITKNYKEYTTLKEEVEHARIYADIQAVRFANRLEVSFGEYPQECADLKIPKLILQPIIENAFKYGLEGVEFDGRLIVRFERKEEWLWIIVEDNGETFADDEEKMKELNSLFDNYKQIREPSGLFNINRRIKILFGEQCGIHVEKSGELGGLKVIVSLQTEEGI